MKILVVDDEKLLVKGIKFNLENEGYQVETCYDGEEAVEKAAAGNYDLILLDIMMPKMDGLEACMHIRQNSMVPIIMLTAKGDDTDKIIGLEYGADDYITKPFNILELKARVRALLRRSNVKNGIVEKSQIVEIGDLRLDALRRAAFKSGKEIDLTLKEYDLAELFMKNPGKVYSRENLLDIVWGYDFQGDARTVDVHIRRLREKLETDPANPSYFCTKWGVGYYFKA
ncbi:MAG: response regulator transcription factor [Ruminococcaceae bacterium]|nr:response regulator transcription factor [Oscillospiraceae bacterium]